MNAEQAFAAFHKPLQRYLVHRLRENQGAQDLAQEVYARLIRVPHFELVRQPQAYVFRIASRLIHERVAAHQRSRVVFDSCLVDHAADRHDEVTAEDPADALYNKQFLNRVLSQLRPLDAAILILKKGDGCSLEEIADELDLSIHTVKKYLTRAVATARLANWSSPR